jgi:hypothetical protein
MKDIRKYSPVGKKDCQGMCDREIIIKKSGLIIVCHGCERVVMNNMYNKQ